MNEFNSPERVLEKKKAEPRDKTLPFTKEVEKWKAISLIVNYPTGVINIVASRNAVIFFGATSLFMFLKIANRKDERTSEKPLN